MCKRRITLIPALLAFLATVSWLAMGLSPMPWGQIYASETSNGLAYLPEKVNFIGRIDVQKVLRSPLYSRLQSRSEVPAQLDTAFQNFGLNAQQDILEILIGMQTPDTIPSNTVVFVRGPKLSQKFSTFINSLNDPTLRIERHKGYEIIVAENGRDVFLPAVILDGDLIAFGDRAALKSCLDVRVGEAPGIMTTSRFTEVLAQINQGDAFWFAGLEAGQVLPPLPTQYLPVMSSSRPRHLALSGNLDFGITSRIVGIFADNETAHSFASMLQRLLLMAKLQGSTIKPEELALLDGLRIEDHQNRVIVSVQIPYTLVDLWMGGGRQVQTLR